MHVVSQYKILKPVKYVTKQCNVKQMKDIYSFNV